MRGPILWREGSWPCHSFLLTTITMGKAVRSQILAYTIGRAATQPCIYRPDTWIPLKQVRTCVMRLTSGFPALILLTSLSSSAWLWIFPLLGNIKSLILRLPSLSRFLPLVSTGPHYTIVATWLWISNSVSDNYTRVVLPLQHCCIHNQWTWVIFCLKRSYATSHNLQRRGSQGDWQRLLFKSVGTHRDRAS